MYIDGNATAGVEWSYVPTGRWIHLHLETSEPFSDDLNIMSAESPVGLPQNCLQGKLASVYTWGRVLPASGKIGADGS